MVSAAKTRLLLSTSVAVVGIALFPFGVAHAQTPVGAGAEAEALAELKAGNLLLPKDMAGACVHFRAGMKLVPSATLLARIGECLEFEGNLRQAVLTYRQALEQNRALNASRPMQRAALETRIQKRLDDLTPRVPTIVITLWQRPRGLELELDGESLSSTEIDAPVLVNPLATHRLVVRAPGYQEAIAQGSAELAVTLVPDPPPPAPEPPVAEPVPPTAPAPAPRLESPAPRPKPLPHARKKDPGARRRSVGYAAGVGGIGLLGAAGYFGIRTLSLVRDARAFCDSTGCDDPGLRILERARTAQTTGFVLLGAGVATLGLATALVVTAKGPSSHDEGGGTGEVAIAVGLTDIRVRATW